VEYPDRDIEERIFFGDVSENDQRACDIVL
jgi:hypothetical protein